MSDKEKGAAKNLYKAVNVASKVKVDSPKAQQNKDVMVDSSGGFIKFNEE